MPSITMPSRNLVPPPQLAGNAPVLNIGKPLTPQTFQVRAYRFACIKTVHPSISGGYCIIKLGIQGQNFQHRQIVTQAHLIIIEVMRRSYFDRTATKCRIHRTVCNNWNVAIA
ncbi:hypothetical protein BGZ92_011101 [Podila epicladia]|nr:hypothetical protein BGZ92_011101 [Podila epicladia]